MKERDRVKFQEIVRQSRANGSTLTEAIEIAYSWLLKRAKDVWT